MKKPGSGCFEPSESTGNDEILDIDGDTATACTPRLDRIYSFDLVIEPDGARRYSTDVWRDPMGH
jgi:hypothetical protein